MFREIPAPGYTLISGKRIPPPSMGDSLYCQLRNGWCCSTAWPVSTQDWIHTGSDGDIIAVRRVK